MGMNIQAFLTDYEFDQMSRYLKLIQASIDQQLIEIENSYNKMLAKELPEYDSDFMEDHYTDKYIEAGEKYPQMLYSGFIILWYSFIEQKLLDICSDLELVISIKPKDQINLEKGIRRARSFLIQARSYVIHPPHWEELTRIGRLRNQIVHSGNRVIGSYINSDDNMVELQDSDGSTFFFSISHSLIDYMKSHNLINHSGVFLDIGPAEEYCHYLINFGKDFFARLYRDLYPRKT